MKKELSKVYEFSSVEKKWYSRWEKSNSFKPKNNDESFTWRISQANKFFNEAISGKNNKKTDDQSELVDDLEAINNLIKDRIWIKKNY